MPLPSYYNVKPAGSGNPPKTSSGGIGPGKTGGAKMFRPDAVEYQAPYTEMRIPLSPIDGDVLKLGTAAKGTYRPIKGNH